MATGEFTILAPAYRLANHRQIGITDGILKYILAPVYRYRQAEATLDPPHICSDNGSTCPQPRNAAYQY